MDNPAGIQLRWAHGGLIFVHTWVSAPPDPAEGRPDHGIFRPIPIRFRAGPGMGVYDVGASLSHIERLLIICLQQTTDNVKNVKEIERRVQSLSGVLASPVSEDDYAEKGRRVELWRFVFTQIDISLLIPLSGK